MPTTPLSYQATPTPRGSYCPWPRKQPGETQIAPVAITILEAIRRR